VSLCVFRAPLNEEIAYQAIQQFVGNEIPEITLRTIKDTLCFDFPLIEVEKVFS
jgi:threonine synthase